MVNKSNIKPSKETTEEAMQIAKATQRPGQKKAETQLIAQGIEKGISLYKKQQKAKARSADKAKKQQARSKTKSNAQRETESIELPVTPEKNSNLPWILLTLSWLAFITYFYLSN